MAAAKVRFIVVSSGGDKVGTGYFTELGDAVAEAESLNAGTNQPWDGYRVEQIFIGNWAEHA